MKSVWALLLLLLFVVVAGVRAGPPPQSRLLTSSVLDKLSPVFDLLGQRESALQDLVRAHAAKGGLDDLQPLADRPEPPVAVVIGAGPAGLYAAIRLAKTHRVIVYDKYAAPNRARFLGLFTPERELFNRLGLSTQQTTYYPDGKETKRGILSADLDLGLMYVAEALGVKLCRGYEVKRLADQPITPDKGLIAKALRVKRHRSHPFANAPEQPLECEDRVVFDLLVWAGGSRNHQLNDGAGPDFPSKFLGSNVIPLEEMARRGWLARFANILAASIPEHPKQLRQFLTEARKVLSQNAFDAAGVERLLVRAKLVNLIDLNDKDTLKLMVYDSYEAGVKPKDGAALELALEIFKGAFEDVVKFSPLGRDAEHEPFVVDFWNFLSSRHPELARSFFVSNIDPQFFTEYVVDETNRARCANRLSRLVPDWLFLNLGVREEGKRESATSVRRVHWEGPLPHKQYQEVKKRLMKRKKIDVDPPTLSNRITYEIMNVLAKDIGVGGIDWDRYLEENKDRQDGATRSASVFESRFAASVTTQGLVPRTGKLKVQRHKEQRWAIVGDAAQDAWYRFGLGIHDAITSVDAAMKFLLEHQARAQNDEDPLPNDEDPLPEDETPPPDDGNPPAEDPLHSYRNFQAVRALQITHAVFAGQYVYEHEKKDFAKRWMADVERNVNAKYADLLNPIRDAGRAALVVRPQIPAAQLERAAARARYSKLYEMMFDEPVSKAEQTARQKKHRWASPRRP